MATKKHVAPKKAVHTRVKTVKAHEPEPTHHLVPKKKAEPTRPPFFGKPTIEQHIQGVKDNLRKMGKADARHFALANGLVHQDIKNGLIDTAGKNMVDIVKVVNTELPPAKK